MGRCAMNDEHKKCIFDTGGAELGWIIACDFSVNHPKSRDIANCIAARCDRGISNHRQEGTCVVEYLYNDE